MTPTTGWSGSASAAEGPAARAGLRPGDLVLALDGMPVASARELIRIVAGRPPGERVQLEIRRGNRTETLAVRLGRRPVEGG